MTRSPYERVTRSVSALLTGSSRQSLNGFIGVPPLSRRIGPAPSPMPDLLFRAKHLFLAAMVAISPAERSRMRNGLFGPQF